MREEGWEGGGERGKEGGRAMTNKTIKLQTQAIGLPYWLMRPTPKSVEHYESWSIMNRRASRLLEHAENNMVLGQLEV